jgi:predicted SAM-dependent methyltransferase
MLTEVGALIPVDGDGAAAPQQDDPAPGALVDSRLRPLSEIIYRLAGSFAALSPEAARTLEQKTGRGLRNRLEALVAGASALELELKGLIPSYLAAQLEGLGIDENSRNLKIHIGAGLNPIPGWVNLDGYPAELALDVTWGLPFADGCADYVFMSHMLEHLYYPDDALAVLSEARRVLAPGGRIRVIVPDIARCLTAYVEDDAVFFDSRKDSWGWWPKANTRLEDFLAYAGAGPRPSSFIDSHKFGYDFETLTHILREAGFAAVERSDYMAAEDPVLKIDDVSVAAGARYGDKTYSLFIEATV